MANNKPINDINFEIQTFARSITPQPDEPKQYNTDSFVKWGTDNLYPNFLIKLMDESAIHGGILDNKNKYVYGDGILDEVNNKVIGDDIDVNDDDSLADLVRGCIEDMVLFNGFAVKVEFNLLGEPLHYTHVPFHHIRSNRSKSKFFVNDDWFNYPRTYFTYEKFNPKKTYGVDEVDPKIFYYTSKKVSVNNVYTKPSYNSAIEDILTDTLISQLFKNNVGDGFSLTKVITNYGAIPNDEGKRLATRKFKDVFSGTEGDGFLLAWATDKDKKMEVDVIPSDDYASKLIEVIKKCERNILTSHNVSSGALFGINGESTSLNNGGGEQEMAYQLFKDNFVKTTRNELIGGLNKMFQSDERIPELALKDRQKLFSATVSDATKERILSINELRVESGYSEIEGGNRLLDHVVVQPASAIVKSEQQSFKKKDDDVEFHHATVEDFEKIKDYGTNKDQFITITTAKFSSKCGKYQFANPSYKSIEEYLLENKIVGLRLDEVSAKVSNELGYSVSKTDVQTAMQILENANLINTKTNITTGQIHTAPTQIAQANSIEVFYDYVKRSEADGATILPTSRHFCQSIISSNKYYSASDIQQFSGLLGYSVMQYGGGYWRNKKTGVTTKHCRHEWQPVRVIKK